MSAERQVIGLSGVQFRGGGRAVLEATTRSEAINLARGHYLLLVERARSLRGKREFVDRLSAEWDAELRRLAAFGSSLIVPAETYIAVRRLIDRSGSEAVPADSLLDWIDAFPEAVADLFPPSAVTYRLVPGTTERPAGNRRQTFALAA